MVLRVISTILMSVLGGLSVMQETNVTSCILRELFSFSNLPLVKCLNPIPGPLKLSLKLKPKLRHVASALQLGRKKKQKQQKTRPAAELQRKSRSSKVCSVSSCQV